MKKELYRVLVRAPEYYKTKFDIYIFQHRRVMENFLNACSWGSIGKPNPKDILKIQRISARQMKQKVIRFIKGYGTLWVERDRIGNWVAKFNPIEDDEFGTQRWDAGRNFPKLAKSNWQGSVVDYYYNF